MRAIFAEAVEQDFLPKDPARSIKVPSELQETDKTTLNGTNFGLPCPGFLFETGLCSSSICPMPCGRVSCLG